ncbi:MAG: UDP-N-acetylglucosamine 2-epimerase (non-hydrolyzing) [Clostridiales bacterium]|nr:UDP-N-acetylglucosamine 2-epimerase (non-hydrolyzing) [Clostridiales bacterium]
MLKVLSIFGTRPEAIKMAPLVKALAAQSGVASKVAVTAQHREMLDQVLSVFAIKPDYDLDIMRPEQTLEDVTSAALRGLSSVIADWQPQLVLVHGDTTTTLAGALAAFYAKTPCGHVEAGLRTADKYAPYPEEINRRLTAALADWHFAPTPAAEQNLLKENVAREKIFVTGNTVIDALLDVSQRECDLSQYGLRQVDWQKRVILLTCHRRENWGRPMHDIFQAVKGVLERYKDVEVVFPVHKNPLVRVIAHQVLGGLPRARLVEPLDYLPFCHVLRRCHLVLTDSGGLQEEAPALGKPVIVLREVTERPEALEAGTAVLAGVGTASVRAALEGLLFDKALYEKMARAVNPFGDGQAAQRITEVIMKNFG